VTVTQAEKGKQMEQGTHWQILADTTTMQLWTTLANSQVCNNRSSIIFSPLLWLSDILVSSGEFYWTLRGELLRHVESGRSLSAHHGPRWTLGADVWWLDGWGREGLGSSLVIMMIPHANDQVTFMYS
jgi:hypothetical protein